MNCIIESLDKVGERGQTEKTGWWRNHLQAWSSPRGVERGITGLFKAAADYADTHKARFETPIGEDYFLGTDGFLPLIKAIRVFLNGELGRLDGGTLDALLFAMLEEAGFTEADKDEI